ncbi:hypothetical protein V1477_010631 [Vespula maculifrons]|uniref:Uncharacterized protein n=1 Tax=Vespula maculifrons TaxID=7453 RepID=A0ABD2C2H8_VESMC
MKNCLPATKCVNGRNIKTDSSAPQEDKSGTYATSAVYFYNFRSSHGVQDRDGLNTQIKYKHSTAWGLIKYLYKVRQIGVSESKVTVDKNYNFVVGRRKDVERKRNSKGMTDILKNVKLLCNFEFVTLQTNRTVPRGITYAVSMAVVANIQYLEKSRTYRTSAQKFKDR